MQRFRKADLGAALELAEFTCFTGTKVQILTQKALLDFACDAPTPNDLVRWIMGGQVDLALMNEFSVDLIFQALNSLALLEK